MKNRLFLFCIFVIAVSCVSCQKELTETDLPVFWGLTSITVTDAGSGTVTATYNFDYDSATRKASKLSFQSVASGVSRTINPTYARDTVYLNQGSFLILDASKRIKQLAEFNARPGISNGDYFYAFNGEGQLTERLYDDNLNDVIRTTFEYDKGDLVEYAQDYKGYPLANTASLEYLNTPRITRFGQYSLLEIFPELLLYMPCLSIGRSVLYPLDNITSEVSIPAPPIPPYTTDYSNFEINSDGFVTSFETKVQIGGGAPKHTHYELTYQAFN